MTMEKDVREELGLVTMDKFGSPGGGCLCKGQGYHTDQGDIYVKYCDKPRSQSDVIFQGEFSSLQAIYNTHTIKVPKPIKICNKDKVCLVTEYLDIASLRKKKELGHKFAEMHLHNAGQKDRSSSVHEKIEFVENFGFDVQTCCGVIPQPNEWRKTWVEFYSDQKLRFQIDMLLNDNGDRELKELWPQLERKIPEILNFDVYPALLHGDLWSGNIGQVGEEPVIFDAASFYGHSEFDLAIAIMFGGFSSAFFDAYHERCPKLPGYDERMQLYQLFHYLNHWNHFGSGYRSQSIGIMRSLVE